MINISDPPLSVPPAYYDNYSGPANPACFLTLDAANDWGGQSFTTSLRYNLASVELWIKKVGVGYVGKIDVELYAVDGNGHPTGSKLNSGFVLPADISEEYSWILCALTDMRKTAHRLEPATKYCIVVHGTDLIVSKPLIWACGGDGSDYPGGDQEWSINGGVDWSTDTTKDQLFRCYPTPWLDNYCGYALGGGLSKLNGPNVWAGQSFTAMKSYSLDRIDLYICKEAGTFVGDILVQLFHVDGEGKPTGPVLTSGVIPDANIPEGVWDWIRCDLSAYDVFLDTKYAIVVKGPSTNPSNYLQWLWDNYAGASDFEGGDSLWTINGGSSWTVFANRDYLFRCYD